MLLPTTVRLGWDSVAVSGWCLYFRRSFSDDSPVWRDARVVRHREVLDRAARAELDTPFLVGPNGRVDVRVNRWFISDEMQYLRPATRRKYAHAVRGWLTFLSACGLSWDAADRTAQHAYKTWRLHDSRNSGRVSPGTYFDDLVALYQFHSWALTEYGTPNPIVRREWRGRRRRQGTFAETFETAPAGSRDRDVKWFDPDGFRRYRDMGLLGLDAAGEEDTRFRGRNAVRDGAFADLLYGTGLRLTEGGSLLISELPEDDPLRYYRVCRLADETAKGGFGREYWTPRRALTAVLSYIETERAMVVRRAQARGVYEDLSRSGVARVIVMHTNSRRLRLRERSGRLSEVSLDALGPAARRTLLVETEAGLEPAAVWLNEGGLPREPHAWEHTFKTANTRLARMGLRGFAGEPHMLRHSFALRWYSVGRLIYEAHYSHLSADELLDFRAQFGNDWDLVQMLLGHRSPQTTREIYLEPFRSLDIEMLIIQAAEEVVPQMMMSIFQGDRRVLGDPFGGRGIQ